MQAKGDWVIVCRRSIPNEKMLKSGVILPYSRDEEFYSASVVSIGEAYEEESKIHKGDYVFVRNGNGIKVGNVKAGEYYAVDYMDVICVLEEDDEDAN